MTNYVLKYRKIVNELVEKNFPELKGEKIFIKEYEGDSYGVQLTFILLKYYGSIRN